MVVDIGDSSRGRSPAACGFVDQSVLLRLAAPSPARVCKLTWLFTSPCRDCEKLASFCKFATIDCGLLSFPKEIEHRLMSPQVKSEDCWIFSPGPHPLRVVF
jgi:hypothetical protein